MKPEDVLRSADAELAKADQVLERARREGPPKFTCQHCGGQSSKVTNSRGLLNDEAIRRRRECLTCGARWSTIERIDRSSFKKSA